VPKLSAHGFVAHPFFTVAFDNPSSLRTNNLREQLAMPASDFLNHDQTAKAFVSEGQ